VRLDLWLWAARFLKTRSLAKQAIEGGKIVVNGQSIRKPAKTVQVGDLIELTRGLEHFEIEVLAIAEVRGPFSFAQTLYRETQASELRRAQAREQRRLLPGAVAPVARPDKRARRELLDWLSKVPD
jgi:ribosome-associated heat shock protein Hsp15